MNKKIISIITIIIIISMISIFAVLIIKNSNKKENLTNNLYNKIIESNEYSFLIQNNNNYKNIISKKQENISIDMYSDNYHTTTLTNGDGTYVLMHDTKEYSYYETNDMETDIVTDELYDLKGKEYNVGKENIDNKTYKYEEYTGLTAFSTITYKEVDEEKAKTRLYFDNDDNLVYIKTIIEGEEELLEVQISFTVNDDVFKIPEEYAEL